MLDRDPRYDIHEDVQVHVPDLDESFHGISLNVSETGTLLRTTVDQPHGTEIELSFPSFFAKAKVIWTKELGEEDAFALGVKFTALSAADREALHELLEAPAKV